MPKLLKKLLGLLLLFTTIELATCKSMVRAEPVESGLPVSSLPISQF